MFDTKFINDMAKRLSESLPSDLTKAKKDVEKNFRAVLKSMLVKMDLVTREEFDLQKNVLLKTRAKLNTLGKQVADLEKGLSKPKTKGKIKST
jgi:ubiquinone biosynthesis accessory factor UbiK